MTEGVITRVEQVSAQWLTDVLLKSGALTEGAVEAFEFGTGQGNWSSSARIILRYTAQSKGLRPERLFLKMVDTDLGDGETFDNSEVNYYTRDYVDVHNAPLLRCYDAGYSKTLKRYHILLDDVKDTHISAAEKEPTLEYGLALAEGLAVLHARWWGANRLAEAGVTMHSTKHIQNFTDIAAPGVEHILRRFSTELKSHWPGALQELFAKHPQAMLLRTGDLHGFTIIHGDVGVGNVLIPRQGNHPIYIIDRQPFNWSLTIWLGVYDIAYALVLDWDIEKRRQYEIPILKHYHEQLVKNRVPGYTWEQLYSDYRLCVAMCVYIAVEYCRGGVNEQWVDVWLPMLKRALTACDDLECGLLWQEKAS